MNCDQCRNNLESDNPLRRFRARAHARCCPRCGEMLRLVRALRKELSGTRRLSAAQRRLWLQALEREPDATSRTPSLAPACAVTLAALAMISCALLVLGTSGDRPSRELPTQVADVPDSDVPALRLKFRSGRNGLDKLESKLLTLSERLDRLSRHAPLLEEHREVQALRDRMP